MTMNTILEYQILNIIMRKGSVWNLRDCGFSSIEIYVCLQNLSNRKLLSDTNGWYRITETGKAFLKKLCSDNSLKDKFLLHRVAYRDNQLKEIDVYLSRSFLLESAKSVKDIKSPR